jgi:hypothetical protein
MTIEEFQKAFPGVPFALHYVKRGEANKRKFGWHASFTNEYWTSDTDRPIYNHNPPHDEMYTMYEAWGKTPYDALDALTDMVLNGAANRVEARRKSLIEAEDALKTLRIALND